MIERRRRIQVLLQLLWDLLGIALTIPFAYYLRFSSGLLPVDKGIPSIAHYLFLIPAALLIWPSVFYFQGLYQRRRIRARWDEAVRLLSGTLLATALLVAASSFYRPPDFTYSRLYFGLIGAVAFPTLLSIRFSIAAILGRIRRSGRNLQHVLVVGAGSLGKSVVERLQRHVEYGFRVVGFLDDDPGLKTKMINGVPVLGATSQMEEIVRTHSIDQIIFALPMSAHHKMSGLIRKADQLLMEIRVVPDFLRFYAARGSIEELDSLPMINLTNIPLQGWNQAVKRTFDLIVGSLMLIFTAPLFPWIAWRIKSVDGGPIFFTQIRTGLDGRSFKMYKFRSMRIDAEEDRKWTRSEDDRVTPIGSFLRRTNLDELPQLINVIKGEMSLIGPRPEQPEFVEKFQQRYPEYNARHRVRAGLTGWAQVNGLRGDSSIRQRISHDIYYVENWSFAFDLKILFRTLFPGKR